MQCVLSQTRPYNFVFCCGIVFFYRYLHHIQCKFTTAAASAASDDVNSQTNSRPTLGQTWEGEWRAGWLAGLSYCDVTLPSIDHYVYDILRGSYLLQVHSIRIKVREAKDGLK